MRLGIIGAANIADKAVIEPAKAIDEVELVGIAARDPARAEALAQRTGIERVYPTYADLIADGSLDAVYIPLANSLHAEWTIAALEAGRHVLCEKPLTSNAPQAETVVETAQRCGRLMVEAFHWRYHPVAYRILELSRQIGPLQRVEAHFNVRIPSDNVRFQLELAGGGFMDLGCYCVHMVRTVVGSEPEVLRAEAVEGPPGIDLSMRAELSFPGGLPAVVSSSMVAEKSVWPSAMTLRAWGKLVGLKSSTRWRPKWATGSRPPLPMGQPSTRCLTYGPATSSNCGAFCRAVAGQERPLTGGQDSIDNMRVIDAVYEASGLGIRH